jgi:hypothetical protein
MFNLGEKAVQIIHIGTKKTAHIVTVKALADDVFYCDDTYHINYDKTGKELTKVPNGWSELVKLGK